jgi:hypothetical protein
MKQNYFILLFLFNFILVSCIKNQDRDIAHELKSFLKSTVDLGEELENVVKQNTFDCDFILILYVDSTSCIPCTLEETVILWKQYQKEMAELKTKILFIVQNSNEIDIDRHFSELNCLRFYDKKNEFRQHNKKILDFHINTFLIDKKRTVMWIGSPIANKESWMRYKKMMKLIQKQVLIKV